MMDGGSDIHCWSGTATAAVISRLLLERAMRRDGNGLPELK